jgi:hypothetical protein
MRAPQLLLAATLIAGFPTLPASAHRVHITCIDGVLGAVEQSGGKTMRGVSICDVDGKCDNACTFALCLAHCRDGSPCIPCPQYVPVPSRVRRVVRDRVVHTTYILRCLPHPNDLPCTSTSPTIPPTTQ